MKTLIYSIYAKCRGALKSQLNATRSPFFGLRPTTNLGKKYYDFARKLRTIPFFQCVNKQFINSFFPIRFFSRHSRENNENQSKENILKGKSLLWRFAFWVGYYYEARRIRRRHKKTWFTKLREFAAWLGYNENPSYRILVWKPSKKENKNIQEQVKLEGRHFYWWMIQEMKDMREEGLISPKGKLIDTTTDAIRTIEWAMQEERRHHLLMYRKQLRQDGYSEEKIKEMTTAYMPDGKPYELSDTETVSRRLNPYQIQERDKMRYILSRYEETETLIALAIRNEALQEDEQFDPINFPPIPVWRYNPAVWNNPYASWSSIENEFLARYHDLDESRARRESQAVACWAWWWGAMVFFGFFIQGLNTTYGPFAEADWDGFMLNNFLHPIEDHLTHFDWIIPTPHRVWGFFGEGHWWIPYYKHFLWPEPYYHEMWDTQIPEALHPLDGVLYVSMIDKKSSWILVHDYSMLYPVAPVAGEEGLFTYDVGLDYLDRRNWGSGGLAETIWSTVSYGPWTDDFSCLDFDPCPDQRYPVIDVLRPKVMNIYTEYLKWYQQSWYRKGVLFFARHLHMWMWDRPTADHLFWFDHLVIFFFWWPMCIYFIWSNSRNWVVDWEVCKVYCKSVWREARTGYYCEDQDPDMAWEDWYFRENVRLRVLYMHTDWGFHMNRPLFPQILLEGSDYPTDYTNDPRFNGAEVGVFIQMLGVHFDVYEQILVEVYGEQGSVYNKWRIKFEEENAALIASIEKKRLAKMEDDAFIAAMRAENPYIAANFLAERRYSYYRSSMTFVFREINLAEEISVEPGWLQFKALLAKHTVNPSFISFVDRS